MSYKFTPKQLRALAMLASGVSPLQIAHSLKMRRETLARWKKIPEFMYEYEKLMDEVCHGIKNRITEALNTTLESLTYEAGGTFGDPKRMEMLLKIIKTLENETITSR